MTMQPNSVELDRILRLWNEYFLNLGPTTPEGTSIPGFVVGPAPPPAYFDSLHSFASPSLQTRLDVQWVQEHPQNSFFVVSGVLYYGVPPQIALPINEPRILVASASTPLAPFLSPLHSQAMAFVPPSFRKIPQDIYKQRRRQQGLKRVEPVVFLVDGYPGVNMADALHNRFPGLEGRDDPVLQDGRKAFSCRISFPGYPSNKPYQIFTRRWNKGSDPIVRSNLAYHIAVGVKRYLDAMGNLSITGGSINNEWAIGQGSMFLEKMYLAKLDCVSKGSFQPEIWVVDPLV